MCLHRKRGGLSVRHQPQSLSAPPNCRAWSWNAKTGGGMGCLTAPGPACQRPQTTRQSETFGPSSRPLRLRASSGTLGATSDVVRSGAAGFGGFVRWIVCSAFLRPLRSARTGMGLPAGCRLQGVRSPIRSHWTRLQFPVGFWRLARGMLMHEIPRPDRLHCHFRREP